ncbi:DUF3987 domain-containing protein [uncultured Sphingomonas sp.]|uniref:DUF3987 domain-containing protein n=1 Tax=uncultured Sphingomonas sp. TaxID=158754 RepID=UPI0025D48A86|nr:DUF3987 domain-containing protein [uncultured Sphingomonas sp.]
MSAAAIRAAFDDARPFAPVPLNGGHDSPPVWGKPDMSVTKANLAPAVPFPNDVLGDLWPLVADLAAGAGAPVEYVATSMLAVAASLIGGKRWVRAWEQFEQPCILWAAVVGDPSSNKSPGIDAARFPLRAMEDELAEQHKTTLMSFAAVAERAKAERKQWEEKVKQATRDGVATPDMPDAAEAPDAPERKRLVVQDITPEEMAAVLAANVNGTLNLRDELAGWIEGFERYNAGGRTFWLEAYGGRSFTVDRKSNAKPLQVPFNGVSVLGGIQPEKLRDSLLGTSDDGLIARFMWVWPEAIRFSRPSKVADLGRLESLYRRLYQLHRPLSEQVTIPLDPEAVEIFTAWIDENDADVRESAGLYASWAGKARGLALRLSIVLEFLGWADGAGREPQSVSVRSIVNALRLIDDFLKPHARRVFGDAALPPVEKDAAALARFILKGNLERINARNDVQRNSKLPTLKTSQDVDAALEALMDAGWLREAPSRQGDAPGRQKKDYLVNPAVHGGLNG